MIQELKEYYGGQVAAPVFAAVMAGALRLRGVAPDAPANLDGQLAMVFDNPGDSSQ